MSNKIVGETVPPPPSKSPAKLKIGTAGVLTDVSVVVDAAGRRKTGVEQEEQLIFF
jgi:hypothetical protein